MGVNQHLPLVSVIIPAYNAAAFIARTLESVCQQTYQNLEIIVVDDGSGDRTQEIVQEWQQKDNRIKLIIQTNGGVAAARNSAIYHSQGEFIAPLDADDIWHPTKIAHQVHYMQKSEPSVGLVYTWSVFVDENDLVIGTCDCDCQYLKIYSAEGNVYPLLIYQNFIGNASVPLFRRQSIESVDGYKYNHCEDWELTLRIAQKYQIGVVPAFLVGYRHLTGTASGNIPAMATAHHEILTNLQQKYHLSEQKIYHKIYQWSESLFYLYIATKAYANRQHWATIKFIFKAIHHDWLILFRWQIYLWLTVCTVKLVCTPFKPIFIHLHKIKPLLKQPFVYFREHYQQQSPPQNFWQLSIYERAEPVKPANLHISVTNQRVLQILQSCEQTNYPINIRDRITKELIVSS